MDNLEKYRHQMLLSDFGVEGQNSISNAKVLVVGAGGLGSHVLLHLVYNGFKHLKIVDFDVVSITNLNRQVLYGEQDIGRVKVEAAKERINCVDSSIEVETINKKLLEENAEEIIKGSELVVDCVDNFETKLLISDTCKKLGIPFVSGGVLRYTGQVFTYLPNEGGDLRELFSKFPANEEFVNPPFAGILSEICGIIASIQALEVVRYFLKQYDKLLSRKLLSYDGEKHSMLVIDFPKD